MARSVVIMGTECDYIDNLARKVAEVADKMFLSMKDLIVYEMQGMIGDMAYLDSDYINSKVADVKVRALEYEDSVISIDVTNLSDERLLAGMKHMVKIYAVSGGCDSDFAVVCDDRDMFLRSIADYVIEKGDIESQVSQIVEIIAKNQ